jgi:hypothetical protein
VRAGGIADDATRDQANGAEYDTAREAAQSSVQQALTCICGNGREDYARGDDKASYKGFHRFFPLYDFVPRGRDDIRIAFFAIRILKRERQRTIRLQPGNFANGFEDILSARSVRLVDRLSAYPQCLGISFSRMRRRSWTRVSRKASISTLSVFGKRLERFHHSLVLGAEGGNHERHRQPYGPLRRELEPAKNVDVVTFGRQSVEEVYPDHTKNAGPKRHGLLEIQVRRGNQACDDTVPGAERTRLDVCLPTLIGPSEILLVP